MRALRHLLLAGKALFSNSVEPAPIAFNRLKNSSLPQLVPRRYRPKTALASVVDSSLDQFELRNWRAYFAKKLTGHGLEIGPLHRPLELPHASQIDYADRLTLEELREHYPELRQLPLVSPNIITDAETLSGVPDSSYDFVAAAHVIEHMKNPIGALLSWVRVLKPGGRLYLIVPDKRTTFDRLRLRTSLKHLILDFQNPSTARDYFHYLEFARFADGKRGEEALTKAEQLNQEDYSIHFHTFMPEDIVALINWVNSNVIPLNLVAGPSMSPGSDEFHLLIERPEDPTTHT